ncbi:S6 modification enzyme RimK [gamma proteobacterium HdN1]|nr:S6 modification enzyme RimK [gamma proteobacterium HdN1]
MNLLILSRSPDCYSTRRLHEAAVARGHEVRVVDTLKCYMDITASKPQVHYEGEVLANINAIIPRIGSSITHYGMAVIRQFETMGIYSLVGTVALGRSRDKFRCLQLLARHNVGLPRTSFANNIDNTRDLIKLVGGAPVVVKLLEGAHGRGVVLAETLSAAESVIDAFRGLHADFLVQEFIREAEGSDIRCFVLGKKVVAAMQRTAQSGEFRSNLHRGGTASLVKLTSEERQIAVRAASTMGLQIAGVDILRSSRGPLVMEVNSSPGLEGIEGITGKDIASRIIEHVETQASRTPIFPQGT